MGKLGNLRQLIKIVFILLIIASITLFIAQSDLSELRDELQAIGYRFIYIVLTTLIAYLFATLAWWLCLGPLKKNIRIPELFAIRQIGETIGLFNPTSIIGGDLFKAQLTSRYDIPVQDALNAVAISRITAVLAQLTLFLIAMLWLMLSPLRKQVIHYTGYAIYIICAVLMLFVALLFCWLLSANHTVNHPTETSSFWGKIKVRIQIVLSSTKAFYQQQNSTFWYSYLLSAAHWIVGSLEFYLLLKFMNIDVKIIHGLVLDMSVIIMKSAGAFIPGQLGVEEISNKLLLNMIGITGGSIWLSISILRRGRQVFWIALGSLFYLFIKKRTAHVTISS